MATIPRQMMGLPNSPSFRYKALNPAYQSDPRRILGQQLMQQGSSSAPVQTPLQGLGRLSSALVGAYLQKGAVDRQVAREDERTKQIMGMIPANATPEMRAFAQTNPELFMSAFGQSIFKPTTSSEVVDLGGNLRGIQTKQTDPFGKDSTAISNLTQVKPKEPEKGFMFNDDGKQVVRPRSSVAFSQAEKFTKPIIKDLGKYKIQINALKNGATSANQKNAAGDAGLIFQFFTALDPGSRVTDGEVQLAKSSQGYGEQFTNEIARVWKTEGQLLGDKMRGQIVTIMRNLAENNKSTVNLSLESITPRVSALGFKPNEIVPDLNFLDFDLEQYSYGQPTKKTNIDVSGNLGFGNEVTITPEIKNSTDQNLILQLTN